MSDPYADLLAQPSAATGAAGADPYGELLGVDNTRQRLKSTLNLAVDVPPAQAAQQRALAKQLSTPVAAVEALPDDAKRAAAVQTVETNTANAPVLRKKYTDADFAKLAHDDSSALSKLEGMVGALGSTARYLVSADDDKSLFNDVKAGYFRTGSSIAGLFRAATEVAAPVLDFLEADPTKTPNDWRVDIGGNPLRRLAEGFSAIAQGNRQAADTAGSKFEGDFGQGVASGVQSLTQNLMMLPMALMTGGESAALTSMAGMAGGSSYQKAREAGVNPYTSALYGASDALVEYATEKLPMHKLLGDLKAGTPFFKTLLTNAALEVPGEQIATALQDLNEWAILHPEKTLNDYLGERPSAALQTLVATLVGSGGQVTLMQAAQHAANNINGQMQQVFEAEQFGATMQQMMAMAAESKLRTNAPDEFAATVQQMADETGGAPSAVYADARLLADALAQSGLSEEQLGQAMPNTLAALREALVQNGSVAIPMGELLATAPGTPLEQALMPILRQSEDGLSQLEAKEAGKQAEQFVKDQTQRVIEQTEQRQANEEQVAQIKQTITDQLNTAGRFRPEANQTYATMVGAFYSTMAQRLGVTPAELYARYPLRVTGEMQTGALEQGSFADDPGRWEAVSAERATLPPAAATEKTPSGVVLEYREADQSNPFSTPRVLATRGDAVVGSLDVVTRGDHAVGVVQVRKEDRRKGIATAMYAFGEKQVGLKFRPDTPHSADAAALWANPKRPFGDTLAQQTRATFSPEQMLIALGPNADYSSFLHEMGHAWLEILNDIATQPGAPEQIVRDMNAVLEWFGIKGGAVRQEAARGGEDWNGAWAGAFKIAEVDPIPTLKELVPAEVLEKDALQIVAALRESVWSQLPDGPAAKKLAKATRLAPAVANAVTQRLREQARQRTPMQEWQAMTLDQKRPYHERWAESTEQYFFEGKAPSVELRGVFDRFRTWLMSVYKSLKQFLAMRAQTPGGQAGAGTLAQSAPAAQAVRAEQTMTKSPVTGKPEFALFDAEGNRLGVYRSAATADEAVANFNQRRTVQSQPEPQVRVDAPQPAASKEPRSNWKIVRGQKFTNLDEDDGYLYHVTSSRAASDIIRSGLVPNSPRTFGNAYAGHSANRVFLTERSGVSYWQEKVEHNLQALYDRPPAVTVVRIPKDKITAQLQPDEVGSADARRPAYYAEGEVLFQTDGKFKPPAGPLNLTDEIRQVMDRLLATDEQITEMERVREFGLLFKSPEEAGMTPEQWAVYTSADERAHAEALTELSKRSLRDMGIVMRKRMRALRDVQRDMAEKRKAVEEEAAAQIAKEPVYQAMRWLKKGEMTTPEGEEVKVTDGFKMDAAAVDAIFPESMPGRPDMAKLRGMTLKKGGLDPAIVADMFGFRDGAHLITSIVEAFPQADQVQGLTDQMMLERYGDLSQPRGMERAADEAVHNENRARVLAAEMATISAANNSRAPGNNGRTVNAMVAAAKQFAERLVESKKVKDLKPQQHTAAEARAARAAEKALAKGDTEGVIVAKRDQLLNFHAAKATNEARIEAAKVEAFFKKIATAKDDVVGKTRDIDVVKAAQAILAAYGVGTKGKAATEYMAVLEKNDPTMFAALKPSIDAALIGAKPVDELTVAELRALNEELQAMWYLAKRSRQMEVDGNLLDIQEAADDLKTRLVEIGIPDTVPGDTSAITPAEQRALKLKGFLAAARRVESWAQAKDGTQRGPFRRLVWEPVREAADRYRADKGKTLKAFKALLDPIAPTLTKRKIAAPELNYTFGEDTDGVALAEILHAVLHTGNESSKRKLLLGRKWATETAEGVLDTGKWDAFVQRMVTEGILQPAHFDFAQGVWDLLEQTKPLAQKTHREVFGKYFAEVTADAFTDPFGVKRRGGYVPAQADSRIVSDKAMHDLLESENASMQFAFPSTNKGFTKGRVEYNRPLLLDLRSLTQHIDKVLLFAHMESHVRDVRRLLTNKSVAYGLNRIDPAAFAGVLTPWLNRAAKQQVETPVAGDFGTMRFFSALRRRAGMAAMFGNVANAVQQLAGFSMAAVRVKPGRLASATAQYMAGPREMTASVAAKSTYMATRLENEVSNMNDAINDILLDPSVYEKSKTFLAKHAYFVQSAVDNVMGPIIWTGAYNQALEQGMEDKDAVRYADSTIRETQGSTAPEDISRIEGGNAFVRMFTQFAGYFNMQANLLGTEFKVIARDLGLRKGLGRGLYVLVFGYLVNAWVAEAIMQAFKGGPDDDDKDGDYLDDWLKQVFGWSLVRNTTAMVPVAGQVGTLAVNMFDSKPYNDRMGVSPAISMIESSVKAGVDAYKLAEGKDVKPSNVIRDVATLISMTAGVPATAFAKPLGYVADVQAGKVTPTSPADAVRGTVTGVASPESKR